MALQDYSKLTKPELIQLARRKKANVTSSMKKDEIIKVIKRADKTKAAKKKSVAAKPAAKTKTKKTVSKKAKPAKAPAVKIKAPSAKSAAKTKPAKAAAKSKTKKKAVAKKKAIVVSSSKSAPVKKATLKKTGPVAKKAKTASSSKPVAAKKTVLKKAQISAKKKSTRRAKPKRLTETSTAKDTPALMVDAGSGVLPSAGQRRRELDIQLDAKKFFTADEQADYIDGLSAGLPESYGDNRIVALVKDPHAIYIYWELDEDKLEQARGVLDADTASLTCVLRVYEVTGPGPVGDKSGRYFDVPVDVGSKNTYLRVNRDDCEYVIAIGLMSDDRRFAPVCYSNRVRTPKGAVSESRDSQWDISDEDFNELHSSSASHLAGSMMGEGISSFGVSSLGASENAPGTPDTREFFLWLNAELVIYGGTHPDASLTLQGQKVGLKPDGTFSVRFMLPEGALDIPVRAVSRDESDSKEITNLVTRSIRIVK